MTPQTSPELAQKIHVSEKLRVSRAWLRFILERGYGMQELIWINDLNIAYYLRIEPYQFPEAFGGKMGYKVSFFSVCCRGTQYFGGISAMAFWLGYMFGIVSVP